jgi:cyclase
MKKKMFSGAGKFLFERASKLRKQQTFAEEILWNYLRTKPFGLKFRRQHPFSCYILDFYCHTLKLAIEVDGSIHEQEEIKQNDVIRQIQLEQEGIIFLRFSNDEIRLTQGEVIHRIEIHLKESIGMNKNPSI